MIKYAIIFLLLISNVIFGQQVQYLGGTNTRVVARGQLQVDSLLSFPTRDTNFTPYRSGSIVYKGSDSKIYFHDGSYWRPLFYGATTGAAGSNTHIQYNNNGALGGSSNFTWDNSLRRLFIDRGSSDSAALTFDGSYTGIKRFLTIRPPVKNDSTVEFNFWSELNPNDDGTRSNHVLKIGSNLTGAKATIPRLWDAWESNWYSGGARYLERHHELMLPNGQSIRLFSNTTIVRSTLDSTTSIWDFRSGSVSFTPLRYSSQAGVFINTGVTNGQSSLSIEGYQPFLRIKDTSSNGNSIFQQVTNKTLLLGSSGLSINATNSDNANLSLLNIGGNTGKGNLRIFNNAGNSVEMAFHSASASNYASQFYIYNSMVDKMVLKQFSSGNIRFAGANVAADQGTRIQLAERAWFGGSLFGTKDSLPTVTTEGVNMTLVIDTTTGQLKKSTQLLSGTYQPTATSVTNGQGFTVNSGTNYQRVGDMVEVYGEIDLDATSAGTDTHFRITLPIASNLTGTTSLSGVAAASDVNQVVRIYGDATNEQAIFRFISVDAVNHTYSFHFKYKIN